MAVDRKLSLDNVRAFLLSHHNGKAKQSELCAHFRDLTSRNVAIKTNSRHELKEILKLITVVKVEEGFKYICLVEQYRSNVAYKNANLQILSSHEEHCNPHTDNQEQCLLSPLASGRGSSLYSYSGSENEPSPLLEKRKSSGKSDSPLTKNPGSRSHEKRPLSAVAGLKYAFQADAQSSVESLNSEDSDSALDEIHPEEKEWMIASCTGNLDTLNDLLQASRYLLDHRDFVFGYTALHWAAKLGRSDIVDFLAANHTNNEYVDIKSHGGYTSLHIAAMCGKDGVINQLIGLGANIHARDHNGKKPKDIVKDTVAAPLQNKLGRPLVIDKNTVLKTSLTINYPTKSLLNMKGRYSLGGVSNGDESPTESPSTSRKRTKSVGVKMTWR